MQSVIVLTGVIVLSGCGGGSAGGGDAKALVNVQNEAPGDNCRYGGSLITSGVDTNNNNTLDPDEVTRSEYVCDGTNGLDALIKTEPFTGEQYGCVDGGIIISTGLDANGDHQLQADEIDASQTVYLCNNLDAPASFSFEKLEDTKAYNYKDLTVTLNVTEGAKPLSVEAAVDNDLFTVVDVTQNTLTLHPKAHGFGKSVITITVSDDLNAIARSFTVALYQAVPKTGKQSYHDFDDGWYQRGVEHNTTLYTSKIVIDQLSGQMWTNVADGTCNTATNLCEGGIHEGSYCSTDAECSNATLLDQYDLTQAVNTCEGLSLDGFDDWVLPDTASLILLMDDTLPSAFTAAFNKNTGLFGFDGYAVFASSDANIVGETGLSFSGSTVFGLDTNPIISVICTRNVSDPRPVSYDITTDNLLLDKQTGLIWTDEFTDTANQYVSDQLEFCQNYRTFRYDDWRLPNINELLSIRDWELFKMDQNIPTPEWHATSSANLYDMSPYITPEVPIYLAKASADSSTRLAFSIAGSPNGSGLRCVRGGEPAGLGPIYGGGLVGNATCVLGSTLDLGTPNFYQPDGVEITSVTFNGVTSPFSCNNLGDYSYSATAVDANGKESSSPTFTVTVERDTPHYVDSLTDLSCISGETITLPAANFSHSDPSALPLDINYSITDEQTSETVQTPDNSFTCPTNDGMEEITYTYLAIATDQYGMQGQSPEYGIRVINPRPQYAGGINAYIECQQNEVIDEPMIGIADFYSPIDAAIVDINLSISFPFDCNRTTGAYTYHAAATDDQGYVGVSPDFTIVVVATEPIYTGGLLDIPECKAENNPYNIGIPQFWMPSGVTLDSLEVIYNGTPTGSAVMEMNCTKNSENRYAVRASFSDGSVVDTPTFTSPGLNSAPQYVSGLDTVFCGYDEIVDRTVLFDDPDNDMLNYYISPYTNGIDLDAPSLHISCLDLYDSQTTITVTVSDGDASAAQELQIRPYYDGDLLGETSCRTDMLPKNLGTPSFLLPDGGVTLQSVELYVDNALQGSSFELTTCTKDQTQSYYALATYSDGTTARSPEYTITGENAPLVYVSGIHNVTCTDNEQQSLVIDITDTDGDFYIYEFIPANGLINNEGTTIIVDCGAFSYDSNQSIHIRASDNADWITLPDLNISKGTNVPPTYVSGISDIDCSDNAPHSMTVMAQDDNGDYINLDFSPVDPWISLTYIDGTSAQFDVDCSGAPSGTSSYNILADDGYNGPVNIKSFDISK